MCIRRVVHFFCLVPFAISISSCTQDGALAPLEYYMRASEDDRSVQVDFCADPSQEVQSRLKYVFVIDKSTSNQQNYQLDQNGGIIFPLQIPVCPGGGCLGTDPTGSRRYADLVHFLNMSPAYDPNRYYSLVNFSSSATVVQSFTNDRVAFQSVVQNEWNQLQDQGATNYLEALNIVNQLISSDIAAAQAVTPAVSSAYVVIFVSDGFPILSIDTMQSPPFVNVQNSQQIIQAVAGIVAMQANTLYVDSINLFTGYYYLTNNQDPNARQLLRDMANPAGNAVAYEFGTGQGIDFNLFTPPVRMMSYRVVDVSVGNASAAWWPGVPSSSIDSDSDAIPDAVEGTLGSNPNGADSDLNGVSDWVEYRVNGGSPCASAICAPSGAINYRGTLCVNDGGTIVGGLTRFPDSDKDFLNDCEERVVNNFQGRDDFDSNDDLIVDGIAYFNSVEFGPGTNASQGDPDFDGVSSLFEIKWGLPPMLANDRILGLRPFQYQLDVVSSTAQQTCYSLKVHNFSTLSDSDLVRVIVQQDVTSMYHQPKLMIAEKRFSPGSRSLVIANQSLEPNVWR